MAYWSSNEEERRIKNQSFFLGDLDVVFDAVGGEIFERSKKVLKKGGAIVSSVAFPVGDENEKYGINAKRVFCVPNSSELNRISELWMAGKLKARVFDVLPVEKVKDALELSESGKANGKIVLKIE